MTGEELIKKIESQSPTPDVIHLIEAYKEALSQLQVKPELIAVREPPGDRWRMMYKTSDPVINGIIEAMTEYMHDKDFKGSYRLDPLDGKLFALHKELAKEVKVKKYSLYGE